VDVRRARVRDPNGTLGPLLETGRAGNGPQVMATFRNIAISLLHLAGVTELTRTLQPPQATGTASSTTCRYETMPFS
jgi:hypothetical protein